MMRAIIRILFVLSLTLFFVACGGGGGSGGAAPVATVPPPPPPPPPPPAPPPTACAGVDSFPSFLYDVEDSTTSPELHLASSDGCRTELIAMVPELRGKTFHMTADGSEGVILWAEDINNQYIVRRLDFTVDSAGVLALGAPVTVLPLAGEEALPGDILSYRSLDIWGDATHDSLYLTIRERRTFNSGPNAGTGTRIALVYDLNDLTDVTSSPDTREIFNEDAGGWQDANGLDCSSVLYPQFVPTCYQLDGLKFNPSGTRLYIPDNINDPDGQRWDATLRIHINRTSGPDIAGWTLTGPELVSTGPSDSGPIGAFARPEGDVSVLPAPEYIATSHRTGGAITEITSILNADQCAAEYAPYADGVSEAQLDLWQGCVDNSTFFTGNVSGGGDSWQSPEAFLKSSFQDPDFDIYRIYVSGGLAGTEQLMIETARGADTGF